MGWGRAVLPRHLIVDNKRIRVMPEFAAANSPVYLNFHAQPFYLPLHTKLVEALKTELPKILSSQN